MYSIYRLKADELDSKFLKSLKSLFEGKDIEIAVTEVEENYAPDEEELVDNRRTIYQTIEDIETATRFV